MLLENWKQIVKWIIGFWKGKKTCLSPSHLFSLPRCSHTNFPKDFTLTQTRSLGKPWTIQDTCRKWPSSMLMSQWVSGLEQGLLRKCVSISFHPINNTNFPHPQSTFLFRFYLSCACTHVVSSTVHPGSFNFTAIFFHVHKMKILVILGIVCPWQTCFVFEFWPSEGVV